MATAVEQLITTGKAVHPIIGVFLDSTYDGEGVRIADEGPSGQPAVAPDGPADEAGCGPVTSSSPSRAGPSPTTVNWSS